MENKGLRIDRIERTEEKEGADGRIRSRQWVFWIVVRDSEFIAEYHTKREAKARLREEEAKDSA